MNLVISVGCDMMVVAKQSSRHKMWTEITRPKYEREGQRYASDLTDAEWALIEPHMPAIKRLGRPRATELRDVLDAILYMARTGCQWRMLPVHYRARLFLRLARRRLVREDQFCAAAGSARSGGPRSKPVGGGDRQSIGQDDRERRAAGWSLSSGAAKPRPGGCGQEDQGAQAPYCDRYRRSAGWCRGPLRRYPRSRWRSSGH